MSWKLRLPTPDDVGTIVDNWIRSYRHSQFATAVDPLVYYAKQKQTIESLLKRCLVVVACNPDDETQMFGWMCFELPNLIHYVYVKSPYRRMGMAHDLIKEAIKNEGPCWVSHWPIKKTVARALQKRWLLCYDPWLSQGETT